ncbi:kinase-like domain-containing protein [Aspergillus karnatakaensis]|uniref:kinase-like domain-containing protein n=1 Tax=Aspergillus karnatakaensis TaxID=1810916 RepID=UPI003CCE48B1
MDDLSIYHQNNLLFTEERLSKYRPGGYHPVSLGDTFKNGRYKVHHKLGWGGFSTVWLAFDGETKRWVALKIKTADSSKESHELQNLELLRECSQGDLSAKYIVELLDSFTQDGPNGAHQCLVFELLGPSVGYVLRDYYEVGDELEVENILRLSEQFLRAVAFIHSAGLGHGDISAANAAFSCSKLSHAQENHILSIIGRPEIEELARLDGTPLSENLPKQLVKAAQWDEWIDEDEEDIRILDFGEAFQQGHEPERLAQPGNLRAPETILTECFDYRVDLWRVGCMIYMLVFRTYPFQYIWDHEALVAQIIGFVEELPTEWQEKWEDMKTKSEYELKPRDGQMSELERRFKEKVSDPELERLLEVMESLMRFLPGNRIEASEALKSLKGGDPVS